MNSNEHTTKSPDTKGQVVEQTEQTEEKQSEETSKPNNEEEPEPSNEEESKPGSEKESKTNNEDATKSGNETVSKSSNAEMSKSNHKVSELNNENTSAIGNTQNMSEESKEQADDDDKFDNTKDVLDDIENLLNDEKFIQSLNVVDAWEGNEDKKKKSERKERTDHRSTKESKYKDQRRGSSKEKSKRDDKRHEMTRRDPNKSSKDIERDKIRTKRDTESKILAEKEKAIKKILDSDTVVPPGTEAEALETIAEKQKLENEEKRQKRSRERNRSHERHRPSPGRRRSPHRLRPSPYRRRSPSGGRRRSPIASNYSRYRSPFAVSPDRSRKKSPIHRRNSPFSSDRRRRSSVDYRYSPEGRRSLERHRRRAELRECEFKFSSRRSRSIERRRSRSIERRRRYSRSPIDRRIGRWRSRSRSRTRSRSLDRRVRKRSPFRNEIVRQFGSEALMSSNTVDQIPSYSGGSSAASIMPPGNSYIPPGPPGPSPGHALISGGPSYVNFEQSSSVQSINYDPALRVPPSQMDFTYSQPSSSNMPPVAQHPGMMPGPILSPKPVPPPIQTSYNHIRGMPVASVTPPAPSVDSNIRHNAVSQHTPEPPSNSYNEFRSTMSRSARESPPRGERLKTPEPPVISDSKLFEKTSLSSLLEASVSAKDSTDPPILYPGFRPEILQHCEHALQNLPVEDPRLKMTGRFFFDPTKKSGSLDGNRRRSSNSILLLKGVNKIYWDEEEQPMPKTKPAVRMQKSCQTEEIEMDSKCIQATVEMASFGTQVYPQDLHKEEKRPVASRLDWNVRETFDYTPKLREVDLRESLNNSQRRNAPAWDASMSPPRGPISGMQASMSHPIDFRSREYEEPSSFRGSHPNQFEPRFERGSFSSSFAPPVDNYRDDRNMREQIPVIMIESEDEDMEQGALRRDLDQGILRRDMDHGGLRRDMDQSGFRRDMDQSGLRRDMEQGGLRRDMDQGLRRDMDWNARGAALGGKLDSLYKLRADAYARSGRSFRGGRGAFHGSNY